MIKYLVFAKLESMTKVGLGSPQRRSGLIRIVSVLTVLVIVIGFYVYQTISPGQAALLVEANVESIVIIDGKDYGKTPLKVEMEEKEVRIKIVPVSSVPYFYETKVKLTEGVKTIVRRKFGDSEVESAGLIISLEKQNESGALIVVVSDPDKVNILVNGSLEGTTPLRLDVSPGKHELTLTGLGYKTETFMVNAIDGYIVTAAVDLGRDAPLDSE